MVDSTSSWCNAMILTALNVEYSSVRAHLVQHSEIVHPEGTVYEWGFFSTRSGPWKIALAQVGAGNARIAFEAERAIAHFHPKVVLFVGVAGGLKDVQLGDVVAATKVYGYESGKASATFRTRPDVGNSTYSLEQRARAEAKKEDWHQRIKGQFPAMAPRVFVAPIAAGEKVIDSTRSTIRQFLKTHYGDALAIEMEGYGFLRAAHANQQVQALVIRGISDLLDDKSEADAADFQAVAARHASAFAFEVLAKLSEHESISASKRREDTKANGTSSFPQATSMRDQHTLHNCGSIQGPTQVGNNNTLYSVIHQVPIKDDASDGRDHLQQGWAALYCGNYTTAQQHLEQAAYLLRTDHFPAESAQIRYLQALVHLNGKRPFSATLQVMRRVEELMQTTIELSPSSSYLYSFALFKRDFARNGWFQSRYVREAQQLMHRAQSIQPSSTDEENLTLLSLCQPHLLYHVQQW
jgi:nucleoside phosphorylase